MLHTFAAILVSPETHERYRKNLFGLHRAAGDASDFPSVIPLRFRGLDVFPSSSVRDDDIALIGTPTELGADPEVVAAQFREFTHGEPLSTMGL